ncbi:unnamed protein product [Didymodactylos carnosus]|uniref:Phytanoyl-CoA dioxygenase family protein n=1 Tax=Didymodactylos carnosus TaxID=1234261 RepID=A0A8S2FVP1_9BILA|nr:unnamed protein product [Didymodactylos carnosus]CAF4363791.1 unnamed protein product [Didymodactylos carnosus]
MLPATRASIARIPAMNATVENEIVEHLERDGVVIFTGMFSRDHIEQVKQDLAPHFDSDVVDQSGFFPSTTQRAAGLFSISRVCVDLAMHPLYFTVANRMLTSIYTFYRGSEKHTAISKSIISSTVGFRVNPGGRQQELHRDDNDYHTRACDRPMMIGCVTALTRTHKNNGAEVFMAKGFYRQAENEYLMVPPERCKEIQLNPAELRVLGYGISQPSCGFVNYKDPMESVFGIIDDETIRM